jgi:hypothetical protein
MNYEIIIGEESVLVKDGESTDAYMNCEKVEEGNIVCTDFYNGDDYVAEIGILIIFVITGAFVGWMIGMFTESRGGIY